MARPGALIGSYGVAGPALRSSIGPSGRPCHSPNRLLGRTVGHASKSSYKLPRLSLPVSGLGLRRLRSAAARLTGRGGTRTFFVLAPHDHLGEPEVRRSPFPRVIRDKPNLARL